MVGEGVWPGRRWGTCSASRPVPGVRGAQRGLHVHDALRLVRMEEEEEECVVFSVCSPGLLPAPPASPSSSLTRKRPKCPKERHRNRIYALLL